MTERLPPGPRLLMVVSKDPGEQALALSLLRGQDLAKRTRVLLRQPRDASRAPLSVAADTAFYSTLADIESEIETLKPDVVVLLSAYLFPFEGIARPQALGAFLQRLRKANRRIVTSDPFLGLASRLTVGDVDPRMLALEWPTWTRPIIPFLVALRGKRTSFAPMPSLEDVIHLYPLAAPNLEDGIERVSFYNPSYLKDAATLTPGAPGNDQHPATERVHWVFVLSEMDVRYQERLVGPTELTENVLRLLRYAVEVERYPTLIAPSVLINRLSTAVSGWADLMPIDQFAGAESRLFEAEYAFFWDAFSMFQLPRLATGALVFPFDRGFYARTITPYYEVARQCYLGGWEPKIMDPRQLFSPYVLAHLANTQREALHAARERWKSSPSPDTVVANILAKEPKATSA